MIQYYDPGMLEAVHTVRLTFKELQIKLSPLKIGQIVVGIEFSEVAKVICS